MDLYLHTQRIGQQFLSSRYIGEKKAEYPYVGKRWW